MLKSQIPTIATNDNAPSGTPAIALIHDDIIVSAWDLNTTKGTLKTIEGAFDDISTVLHLITYGNLTQRQIKALASITQTHASEWAEVADAECQAVNDMLFGGHVTSNANNNAGNVIGNGQGNGGVS